MFVQHADPIALEGTRASRAWPSKLPILGIPISKTDYSEAVNCIISSARERKPAIATALAVHGVVEAARDQEMAKRIAAFDLVTPDGQPVRHALNAIYKTNLTDRVYGPALTLLICEKAAELGIKIYLYGSTDRTVQRLKASLEERFPSLCIAGAEPSLFRPLSQQESAALAERIEMSGAGIVFIGLGCPRQENFAFEHRDIIRAVLVCVGAAFDFHAGVKRQAPGWMQRLSLEWLFRLLQEPRRLFKRYAVTNTYFLWHILRQYAQPQSQHRTYEG
ncbi:WecB/TagA/CpsF family glycosyltransferase [Microvirga solisilvae]|uniref:WecB/TagA/CpsF family glycosyltransferase n=1 Tax=Microvirga solisilvae TaxID=2919498 RepID=UPI001FAF92B6|nr:WecB/TagA/CpsF family glycosyltransferase [Microvirga solisilvae]